MGTILLALAVFFNVIANSLFKAAAAIPDITTRKVSLVAVGLLIGLANTLCFIKALETVDLGIAYSVFSASSILLIALISPFLFREAITLQKAAGLAVICIGLVLTWKS